MLDGNSALYGCNEVGLQPARRSLGRADLGESALSHYQIRVSVLFLLDRSAPGRDSENGVREIASRIISF
jgi:hypothetical protein